MRARPLASLAALGAAALLLTSCASAGTGTASSATTEVETPAGVTIDMPTDPQAALGFYTTDVDMLIALGIPLAPTQPVRDDFSTFPDFFPQEELAGLDTFGNYPEFNLEKVLEVGPDFILNGLGYEEDLDADLQKIAPTYTYNAFDGADWRDSFAKLAADLGREEQHQAWVDSYEARVAEIRAELDEKGLNPVVADMSFWEGEVGLSTYGVPALVYSDLGLSVSPLMESDEAGLPAGDGTTLSLEQLGDLSGIDVVFAPVNEDGSGMIGEEEALAQNALWTELGFVKNDRIYGYNYEISYGSPSGQSAFLEIVAKALLG
jgi:iron complex transport system substrate-binding protein